MVHSAHQARRLATVAVTGAIADVPTSIAVRCISIAVVVADIATAVETASVGVAIAIPNVAVSIPVAVAGKHERDYDRDQ
jgi:hypothetical protein